MQARPVWLFMAATAMATTVSTLAATAMVQANTTQPTEVVCSFEMPAALQTSQDSSSSVGSAEVAPSPEPEPEPEPTAEPEQIQRREPAAPTATVDGKLDKSIIRRIVRAHIAEVRYCYNEGLTDDPELGGRVVVGFTIGTDGAVERSQVSSNDLGDDSVGECIAEAVSRWKFPKATDGDVVQVSYPFVLEPG